MLKEDNFHVLSTMEPSTDLKLLMQYAFEIAVRINEESKVTSLIRFSKRHGYDNIVIMTLMEGMILNRQYKLIGVIV